MDAKVVRRALSGLVAVALLVLAVMVVAVRGRATDAPSRRASSRRLPLAGAAQITFSSLRNGNRDIYVMAIDGSGLRRLTTYEDEDGYPCWSPDAFACERTVFRGGG